MSEPRVTFDSQADALVVVFDEAPVVRTVEVPPGRTVDFDEAGNVVAIEVTGVSGGFALDDLAAQYDLGEELQLVEKFLPEQFYTHFA